MKANVDLSKVCGLRAARCALAPDAFLVLNDGSGGVKIVSLKVLRIPWRILQYSIILRGTVLKFTSSNDKLFAYLDQSSRQYSANLLRVSTQYSVLDLVLDSVLRKPLASKQKSTYSSDLWRRRRPRH